MTQSGGSGGMGAVFSLGTEGNGYRLLHSFAYSGPRSPEASLTYAPSTLYGMTKYIGTTTNLGAVFLLAPRGLAFADDWETGTTGRWSSAQP